MLHENDQVEFVERNERLQLLIFVVEEGGHGQNYHTFHNIEGDITLTDVVIFCYRGILPKTCTCRPLAENVHFQKRTTMTPNLPPNSLILGTWLFPHPPCDQVPDEQKRIVFTTDAPHKKDSNLADSEHSTCDCTEARTILEQFCGVQAVSILPPEGNLTSS